MASRKRTFNERVTYHAGVKARARRKLADELIGDPYCFRIPNKSADDAALSKELQKLRDHLAKEKAKKKKAKEKAHERGTVKRARRSSHATLRTPSETSNVTQRENSGGSEVDTTLTRGHQ